MKDRFDSGGWKKLLIDRLNLSFESSLGADRRFLSCPSCPFYCNFILIFYFIIALNHKPTGKINGQDAGRMGRMGQDERCF